MKSQVSNPSVFKGRKVEEEDFQEERLAILFCMNAHLIVNYLKY